MNTEKLVIIQNMAKIGNLKINKLKEDGKKKEISVSK
jgi:hypothetical protein